MELIDNIPKEKLRGGFYTPKPIADFILKWAINGTENYDILEPSCGDGIFLNELKSNNFRFNSCTAIEIDSEESEKARKNYLPNTSILNKDFHSYFNNTEKRFDLVVGNPPYIRYQYFDKQQQREAERIFQKANLHYSKLTNAWVSFVIGSSLLLKNEGKIGFVLPAEILQVSYASQLREFLAHFYNKINIVSFKKLVFPSIQQEVVLLLCEKNNSDNHKIEHIELNDETELKKLNVNLLKSPEKQIDFKTNKWTFYFLNQMEIDFFEEIKKDGIIPKIKDFADVEVGMTTGSNEFFTVSDSIIKNYNLEKYAFPLVGRSVQVPGLKFTRLDWKNNIKAGARAYFLKFPNINKLKSNKEALTYINLGERKKINERYKCRIRDEWQIVPSVWTSDALFIRRNNLFPKLILNDLNAYTTDTMHRVSIKKGISHEAFISSFYNSLSLASSEINGRSYGGGVLELMPSEVANILIPFTESNAMAIDEIDEMLRKKKNIEKILDITDKKILKEAYGFSDKDTELARSIWKKLSSRRLNRKR